MNNKINNLNNLDIIDLLLMVNKKGVIFEYVSIPLEHKVRININNKKIHYKFEMRINPEIININIFLNKVIGYICDRNKTTTYEDLKQFITAKLKVSIDDIEIIRGIVREV